MLQIQLEKTYMIDDVISDSEAKDIAADIFNFCKNKLDSDLFKKCCTIIYYSAFGNTLDKIGEILRIDFRRVSEIKKECLKKIYSHIIKNAGIYSAEDYIKIFRFLLDLIRKEFGLEDVSNNITINYNN